MQGDQATRDLCDTAAVQVDRQMTVQKTFDQYGVLRSSSKTGPAGISRSLLPGFLRIICQTELWRRLCIALDAALRADPELAYRYFMRRANRFVTDVLDATGKTFARWWRGSMGSSPNIRTSISSATTTQPKFRACLPVARKEHSTWIAEYSYRGAVQIRLRDK